MTNTVADELISNMDNAAKWWPHNTHLLEDPRIEDYVRYVLTDRGGAQYDGPALITPLGLGELPFYHHHDLPGWGNTDSLIGLQTDVAMYPIYDEQTMLINMDAVRDKVANVRTAAVTCCVCHQPIHSPSPLVHTKPNSFDLIWVSAPPSIVGLPFCKREPKPVWMTDEQYPSFQSNHNNCGPKYIADFNPVLI